jgi:uncharacterized membrane protein
MTNYELYIYFIFAVKVGFILLAVTHIYLKIKGKEGNETDKKIEYWKEKFEFVFIILMAILLIYIFNVRHDRTIMINHETKFLLYLFGFVLIITADWELFLKDIPFKKK